MAGTITASTYASAHRSEKSAVAHEFHVKEKRLVGIKGFRRWRNVYVCDGIPCEYVYADGKMVPIGRRETA